MLSFIACALPTLQKATPRIGASKQWHSLTKIMAVCSQHAREGVKAMARPSTQETWHVRTAIGSESYLTVSFPAQEVQDLLPAALALFLNGLNALAEPDMKVCVDRCSGGRAWFGAGALQWRARRSARDNRL